MNYEGLKDVVVYELRILDLGEFWGTRDDGGAKRRVPCLNCPVLP